MADDSYNRYHSGRYGDEPKKKKKKRIHMTPEKGAKLIAGALGGDVGKAAKAIMKRKKKIDEASDY